MLPVTTQWAVLNIAGPQARALAQSLESDIDFSAAAFPHMSLRTGTVAGSRRPRSAREFQRRAEL
jgi:sarcosine oxidase subunit alpha